MKRLQLLRSKFLRDTATLQVGTVLNAIGNFAGAVALAHLLGPREQGRYYVAISLYSLLLFLLSQGVIGATVSQVAAANARGLHNKIAAWLAFLAKAYVALGIVLVTLGGLLLPHVAAQWLHAPDGPGLWAFWLTFTPLLEMPRVVVCAALQGTRRMRPFAQTENAQELSRVFLVVAGVLVTGTAAGAVLGTLAASALSSVIGVELYLLARREDPRSLPSFLEIARVTREVPLRAGLPLGVKLGLVRSIDALAREILPSLLLQRFGSSEWVAYLRIAQRLLGVPLMFMQGASRTALPMLSELAGLKDLSRFRRTYWKASLYSGVLISSGLLLAIPLVPTALSLAFPESYQHPVWVICLILLPGCVIASFSIANDTFYLVSNTLTAGVVVCLLAFLAAATAQTWLAATLPTTGAAWGLSFTLALSSAHFLYAAWWFRRQAAGGGTSGSGSNGRSDEWTVPTAAGPS